MEVARRSLIVIMGVSGCGKSTVGRQLAEQSGLLFLDADDFHPAENIQKMSGGTPLTDQDRISWVEAMCEGITQCGSSGVVLACSALTKLVQTGLETIARNLVYIHLNTDKVDMMSRLTKRDHFMPAKLLQSQYEALSVPETAFDVDASLPVEDIIDRIRCANPAIFAQRQVQ